MHICFYILFCKFNRKVRIKQINISLPGIFELLNLARILEQQRDKHNMKANKQILVCMSGFVHDPNMSSYLQMLQQIGCKYTDQLSLDDDYLIINHTCTQKYKIAQLTKSSTQSIGIQWLKDSVKNKKIMPIQKYKIKKIFYGTKIVLQGFQDKKIQDKVIEILKANGAQQVKQSIQGLTSQQLNEKYQAIIIPNTKFYRKMQNSISQFLILPIVTTEWLQQSIKNKKCKYPNDYALNYQNIITRSYDQNHNVWRLNKKLASFMELPFLNPDSSAILVYQNTKEQAIICLDYNSIQTSFAQLLKKLICVSGGLYLNSYGPVVTHILVGAIQQTQYQKFLNYGDSTAILRVQWLIDSIILGEKLPEIDFKVRSFKSPLIKNMTNLQIKQTYFQKYQYSQAFLHSYNEFNSRNFNASVSMIPSQLNKKPSKSISVSAQVAKTKIVSVTKVRVAKIDIFKGRLFFLQKSQRKQMSMQSIHTKIKQNGGYSISQNSLTQIKDKKLFVVLRDSDKNQQILLQIYKLVSQNRVTLVAVSVRWVDQCVKKTQYIDYNAENYFIFKPFMFDVPLRQLMSVKIQLLGFDDILKRRYKQLLIALGTNNVAPNISSITHCLCGKDYQSDSKYNLILTTKQVQKQKQKETVTKQSSASKNINNNKNLIKFIKQQWLMDIVNKKGKVSIDDYVIQIEKTQKIQ